MTKLKILSWKEALKKLKNLGYEIDRQKGSHMTLKHEKKKPLTVPRHRTLGRGLLRKIIRDAEITPKEFNKL
jgi:predicted RNA binding protein YcfA (HicA-like mRNA interferase family)